MGKLTNWGKAHILQLLENEERGGDTETNDDCMRLRKVVAKATGGQS